jgi:diacylglycerol kinase (ATP)
MRTLLLHNPTAGNGCLSADSLEAALSRSGCLVTACSKHDDSYKAALGKPWDLVAVAGGDGTVAKAARHMPDRNVPLALLPIGTANNVAHSLDLLGELRRSQPICRKLPCVRSTSDRSKGHGANADS